MLVKISQIWRSLALSKRWFLANLSWNIGNKATAKIGLDILSGMDGPHSLSFPLISFFDGVNIQVLKDITVISTAGSFTPLWLDAISMNISTHLSVE